MKLEGVKVLDLSLYLPGPHMTQMMADHGAEVICIEPFPEGEPTRSIGDQRSEFTTWFRNTHRGKSSLCLNLKEADELKILLDLAREADVFVEAFRPGVARRLGFDYKTLHGINPGIVYCSITAFGQTGPYSSRPAHDLGVEALSGCLSLNLGQDGKPALPGMASADLAASYLAFGAISAALFRYERTGQGDYVDISMQDALMYFTPNIVQPCFEHGVDHDVGNARGWGGRAFYNIYETSDNRYITLSGSEEKFVVNLLTALERDDFIDLALSKPGSHQIPLIEFFRGVFKSRSMEEWNEWFKSIDVCYAPVLTLCEALDDPHIYERRMVLNTEGDKVLGTPIKFLNEPGVVKIDPVYLDAHRCVLKDRSWGVT